MIRWTGFVIAHRKRIVAAWLVLFVLGGLAAANLGGLLSNRFSVPGLGLRARARTSSRTAWATARTASFTLVATGRRHRRPTARRSGRRDAARRQRGRRAARPGRCCPPPAGVVYAQITTPLENQDASKVTPAVRARDRPPGRASRRTCPAFRRSTTTPRRSSTRTSGGASRSASRSRSSCMVVHVRHARRDRSCRSRSRDDDPDDARPRLGLRPHDGHGDLRDEHRRADRPGDRGRLLDARRVPLPRGARARPTTRTTRCGRRWRRPAARRCSPALTVAIGLALLVFMPLPFMRSMGVGGLLVPLVSIAASATLLPAMLALHGPGREPLPDHPAARARAPRGGGGRPASGTGSPRRSCAARSRSSSAPAG